jgi:hypothetical protein
MAKLNNYMNDGAGSQARAVLALLSDFEIEDQDRDVEVARWENCREQGYIVSLISKIKRIQVNIAFFEHRNSDSIHAIKWTQNSINSLTIESADFNNGVYENDKYDTTHNVSYGKILEMSKWIEEELLKHYIGN